MAQVKKLQDSEDKKQSRTISGIGTTGNLDSLSIKNSLLFSK